MEELQNTIQKDLTKNPQTADKPKGKPVPLGNINYTTPIENKPVSPIPLGNISEEEPVKGPKPLGNVYESDTVKSSVNKTEPDEMPIDPVKRKEVLSERRKALDKELEQLRQEKVKLNQQLTSNIGYGAAKVGIPNPASTMEIQKRMDEIDQRMGAITVERLDVSRKAEPLNDDQKKELSLATKFNTNEIGVLTTDFKSAINKYGLNKVEDFQNSDWQERFTNQEKSSVATFEQLKLPEGMFTYSALRHAKNPKIDQTEQESLFKEFTSMTGSAAWNGHGSPMPINREGRIKVALSTLKNYVDKKFPEADADFKKNKMFEYSKYFNALMSFDPKDGHPTVEGLQLYALNQNSYITDRYGEMAILQNKLKKLKSEGKLNGQEEYYDFVTEEMKTLNALKQFNEKILTIPVTRSGMSDVWGAFNPEGAIGSKSMSDIASLGVREVKRLLEAKNVAKKLESGQMLTWGEQKLLETYSALQEAEGKGTKGIMYQGLGGVIDMVPYFATFGATSKLVYTPVSKGVKTALTKVLPQSLVARSIVKLGPAASKVLAMEEMNLAKGAIQWTARGIGSLVQTAAVPQAIERYATEREIPEMQTQFDEGMRNIVTTLDKNSGETRSEALAKGFASSWMDFAFEHSGDYLKKFVKMPGRVTAQMLDRPLSKDILVDNAIKLFGYKSWDQMYEKVLKKGLGWHEFWGEYLEELGTQVAQAVVTGDGIQKEGFLEQQLVTALTIGIASGIQKGAGAGIKYAMFGNIGDDVAYIGKDSSGKKSKVIIPKQVHDELMTIFGEGSLIDGEKIDALFNKYVNNEESNIKLNEQQVKFIVDLAMQEGQKKFQRAMVIEALQKNGVNVEEAMSETDEDVPDSEVQSNRKTLSKTDVDKIVKKNEKFKKLYPDLYSEGLLPQSQTGQYTEPTADYLLSLKEQFDEEVNGLMAQREGKNSDLQFQVDFNNALNKRDIVNKYLDKISDNVSVPFNYRLPSEKHAIITEKLHNEEKVEGKGTLVTDSRMLVTLPNGDQVNVYLGQQPGINETAEQYKERTILAQRASRKGLPLEFRLVPKQDWNPDDQAYETVFNEYTGQNEKVPYGDRIEVLSEGKMIGAVQIHNYNEQGIRANKYRKAVQMASNASEDIVHDLQISPDSTETPEQRKERLNKKLTNLIFDLNRNLEIDISQTLPWLVDNITKNKKLSEADKNALFKVIEENKESIQNHVQAEKLKLAGFKTKDSPLVLTEHETSEAVSLTSAMKLNDNLKTFFPLWKQVGEQNDIPREKVEMEFHFMAISPSINSVIDEATYIEWLTKQRDESKVRGAISEFLLQRSTSGELVIPFTKMLSAIDFYSNVRLVKQYGMIFDKKGARMDDLNPPQSYAEFLEKFYKHIETFGFERARQELIKYDAESDQLFKNEGLLTEEERAGLKRIQFERDLELLEKITGIEASRWRSYFYGKTNETIQFPAPNSGQKIDFGSYDNVLNKDSFRPSYSGKWYFLRQSNLLFNLKLLSKERDEDVFRKKFIDYFTKSRGSAEDNNLVFSNLFKLSTSETEIGANGQDVKGDNFSSFQQMSDLYWTVENIQSSVVSNPLATYYKTIGSPMQIVIVNGLHNRAIQDNKHRKGTPSTSMSMEDIWTTLLFNFANGSETYLQNVGQFADKPYIYLVKVPKVMVPTSAQIEAANQLMDGKFQDSVEFLVKDICRNNLSLFKKLASGYPTSLPKTNENYIANENEQLRNFVSAFVYNYAINQKDINEIFFGVQDKISYPKGIVDMFKRAGSTNSPGYRLNTNVIGGVGKTFKFAVINDKPIFDKDGKKLTKNGMDGCVFFSDAIGKKMQVSAGSLYSKEKQFPVLTTTKALMSWKNKATNRRGLVKGNWYNIETMAKDTDAETYKAIRDFMKENKIDVLAIGTSSSVKILDEGQVITMFDEKGGINKSPAVDPSFGIMDKSWDDVFVQQDLRHSMEPKVSKAPTQNFTTMLSLDNGFRIAGYVMELQRLGLENLSKEFNQKEPDESKRDWLLENINEFSQRDLLNLVRMGLTVDDPVYRNMMRKIMASAVNRKALEIPINRIVTIEIPDLDHQLEPMRKFTINGVEKTMLAEAGASVPGGRVHNYKFEGKVEEAIAYVNQHAEKYRDLFDENGNLMEWEIRGRNGVIPGEVIFLTRVPNSGFSTFDVARLKINFKSGNYAMINREGQIASSSDFDGDQRYVQVPFKREGLIFYDETQEGIANQIMRLVVQDYTNPKFFDRIRYMIDTNAYDDIIEGITFPSYKSVDPLAFQDARLNNKVGLDMKGGMTNLLTVYSLISRYNIPFKKKRKMEHEESGFWLTGVARDEFGAIRAHMENFLTMFFDNQKDPKVEKMGFNEISGNMFVLMLIGNEYYGSNATNSDGSPRFKNFNQHYSFIHDRIKDQVSYFTSPLMKHFVKEMRRENGGMRAKDANNVFRGLMNYAKRGAPFTVKDVENLRTLYFYSRELSDIKALHTLTQEAPQTYSELLIAERLVNKAKGNSESTFKLFDLRNIIDQEGNFIPEFRAIDMVLDFSRNFIFDDVVENTVLGKQIYNYIFPKLAAADLEKKQRQAEEGDFISEKKNFTQDELDAINSAINNVFNIRAIGLKQSFDRTTLQLAEQYDKYKESMPGNLFLNFVEKTEGNEFRIVNEWRKTKIHDNILDKIREDFDKLPDNLKDLFSTYQIQKYGSSVSTTNGGFYLLFGNEYKVELSRRAREEMDNWYFDQIDPMEKLAIAQWVVRSNRMFSIRNLQEFTDRYDRLVDYYVDPTILTPLHRDTLEAVESYDDINDPNLAAYKASITKDMVEWARMNYPPLDPAMANSYKNMLHPAVKSHMEARRKMANMFFPTHGEMTDDEVRDFYTGNEEMQMMLSFDEGLNTFIFNHLREQFPGVQFFNDRDAFIQFVRRNINRTIDINLRAVGHAFKNAVFIDPARPVQEALFHEHTHIYWDALPSDSDIKMKLRTLYKSLPLYSKVDDHDLDEFIIRDIGRAGTDFAGKYMNSSILDKFMMLMKDFWNTVKIAFGKYNQTDLINKMVYSVWTNRGKVGTSSNLGDAQLNNLVLNDDAANDVVREDEQFMCRIGDVRIPGITTVIDRFKYDKFDSEKTLQQNINSFEKFWKERTGKEPTDEDVYSYSQFIANQWADRTNAGNTVHLMAREVFSGIPMSPTVQTLNFNTGIASQLRDSFTKLKIEILQKYPDAKFYTELPIVSIKNKVFGYADLVVDIGDHHLLLFDWKTTEQEYKNEDGTIADYYKKEFSFMLPPLTKIKQSKEVTHRLQLSIEAMILEEQEYDDGSGNVQKNIVDGMFIVPVITKLEGRNISEAHISNIVVGRTSGTGVAYQASVMENLIKMDPLKNIANEMLQKYHTSTLDLNDKYMDLKEELAVNKVPFPVADKMLEAYAYLSANSYQPLERIDHHGLSAIRGNGFRGWYNKLLTLGFTVQDMNGDPINKIDPIPFEALLNCAVGNITRVQWEAQKNILFPEVTIEINFTPKLNPKYIASGNGYFHKTLGGNDYYFHEAGTETLSEGDEVIRIDEINYGGHTFFNHEIYNVKKVLKRGKVVFLEHADSHVQVKITNVEKTEGLLKLDRTPDPQLHTGTNNYVAKWIEVKEPIRERHWMDNRTQASFGDSSEAEKNWQRHNIAKKVLYRFFRKYNTKNKVMDVLEDLDILKEIYADLVKVSGEQIEVSRPLMNFLGEEILNHIMAAQIREENKNGPSAFMPMTLNIYKLITYNKDAVFRTLGGYNKFAYAWAPTRKIQGDYPALNWVLTGVDQALLKIQKEQYDLGKKIKPYLNTLDHTRLIEKVGKHYEWRLPSDPYVTEREAMFLKIIYDHYYERDPKYIEYGKTHQKEGKNFDEHGFPVRIRVTRLHATRQELIQKLGRKWGGVIYDIMSETRFDRIKFDVNGKVMTLGEIKELFAIENATDEEIKEWLGPRIQYMFMSIPFIRNMVITRGKLYNYVKEAKSIYENGNKLNPAARELGKSVSPIKDTAVRYKTDHIVEAEAKVMDSNIFAYYMKEMIAPIEYVLANYQGVDNAHKYLKEYTDLIVYKKSTRMGSEWVALADTLQQFTSLRFISYSLTTQGYNFSIGQTQNIVREPVAYGTGLKRIFSGNPFKNSVKAINILRSYGLGNIVDEAYFDTLAKRAGVDFKWGDKSRNLSYESFVAAGYAPMEFIERINQVPIFAGLMTQEEWDSYDINGALIKGKTGLKIHRAEIISDRVRDVHGDYTPKNAAPFWNTSIGASMFQFTKWAPTLIDSNIMPYHWDKNYMDRSGILQSVAILSKITAYKVFVSPSEKARYEYLRKALLRWPQKTKVEEYNRWVNKTFSREEERKEKRIDLKNLDPDIRKKQSEYLHGVSDYMKMLAVASREGRLEYKQLSDQDIRNLISATLKLAMFITIRSYIESNRRKNKLEQALRPGWDLFFEKMATRLQSDMFILLGEAKTATGMQYGGWTLQKLQKPVPLVDYAVTGTKLIVDWATATADVAKHIGPAIRGDEGSLTEWWRPDAGYFTKTTKTALEGDTKFWYDLASLAPAGNAVRMLFEARVSFATKEEYLKYLDEAGFSEEVTEKLQSYVEGKSIKELTDFAVKFNAIKDLMKAAAIMEAIDGHSVEYRDLINGKKLMTKEKNFMKDAISGLMYLKDSQIDETKLQWISKRANDLNELLKEGVNQSNPEIMRKFNEAVRKLDEDPGMFSMTPEEKAELKKNIDVRKKAEPEKETIWNRFKSKKQ
jgi:hypothetical protein